MNKVPGAIARWLEQKRRTGRVVAVVISLLVLSGGAAVFLLTSVVIYTILSTVCGAFVPSVPGLGLVALGLTAWLFGRTMKRKQNELELGLDAMGFWIFRDIWSVGPRLILEGVREVRRCGQLGELNVAACARALAYLAGQNCAVSFEDLTQHCPELPCARLKEDLLLLDGVLFVGEYGSRVTLMDPFRLRLRWMLEREQKAGVAQEPARPRPAPPPPAMPVNEPEKLSPHEILGVPPSASVVEIRKAYRKRVKECHPDLFTEMDQQAQALAERWTRALNAAYATLNPRHRGAPPSSTRPSRATSRGSVEKEETKWSA